VATWIFSGYFSNISTQRSENKELKASGYVDNENEQAGIFFLAIPAQSEPSVDRWISSGYFLDISTQRSDNKELKPRGYADNENEQAGIFSSLGCWQTI
jgi:hypothetical protein